MLRAPLDGGVDHPLLDKHGMQTIAVVSWHQLIVSYSLQINPMAGLFVGFIRHKLAFDSVREEEEAYRMVSLAQKGNHPFKLKLIHDQPGFFGYLADARLLQFLAELDMPTRWNVHPRRFKFAIQLFDHSKLPALYRQTRYLNTYVHSSAPLSKVHPAFYSALFLNAKPFSQKISIDSQKEKQELVPLLSL
jgi:hypothetical protein